MSKILIIDDDVAVTNHLKVFLMQTERFDSAVVNDSRKALERLGQGDIDAVLLDMDMPSVSGLDILKAVHDRDLGVPVVILTGVSDVDLAVAAMKLGAFDYLTKPVDEDALLKVLDDAIKQKSIRQSIQSLPADLRKEDLTHREAFAYFPTRDPAMIRMHHEAEKMAVGDFCIFLWGDRGTYKKMLAQAIHSASPRRSGPFVSVDVAAREPGSFAAEFFGQERDWSGSQEAACGLLEQAAGGTLFLDEIDLLSIPVQIRFRSLVQSGEFYRENSTKVLRADVRFIVASHHDLAQEHYASLFSRDLLYHLMKNSLRIPALQERADDIPLLADYFLKEEAERTGKAVQRLAPELLELLKRYDFPDNVRELKHIVTSAAANGQGEVLALDALPPHIRESLSRDRGGKADAFRPRKLADVEREHVVRTLAHFGNNRSKAAEVLGMSVDELAAILDGRHRPA